MFGVEHHCDLPSFLMNFMIGRKAVYTFSNAAIVVLSAAPTSMCKQFAGDWCNLFALSMAAMDLSVSVPDRSGVETSRRLVHSLWYLDGS